MMNFLFKVSKSLLSCCFLLALLFLICSIIGGTFIYSGNKELAQSFLYALSFASPLIVILTLAFSFYRTFRRVKRVF